MRAGSQGLGPSSTAFPGHSREQERGGKAARSGRSGNGGARSLCAGAGPVWEAERPSPAAAATERPRGPQAAKLQRAALSGVAEGDVQAPGETSLPLEPERKRSRTPLAPELPGQTAKGGRGRGRRGPCSCTAANKCRCARGPSQGPALRPVLERLPAGSWLLPRGGIESAQRTAQTGTRTSSSRGDEETGDRVHSEASRCRRCEGASLGGSRRASAPAAGL